MFSGLLLLGETTGDTSSMTSFVQEIISAVSTNITLADVAALVALIIGSGIVAMFAWKFARKGFTFIKNALSGKNGKF